MYKKNHIIIDLAKKHSKECYDECKECNVLHFHIKKGKTDSLMFFPNGKDEIKHVIDLKKSYYPNSNMTISNGSVNYQFVPEYDTSNYKYYYGDGINSAVNDSVTHRYETVDGNIFSHNIDRNTLFGPITDILAEAHEIFTKSEKLEKAQSTISFPKNKEVDTRPDQNVYPTTMMSGQTRRGKNYLQGKMQNIEREFEADNKSEKAIKAKGTSRAKSILNSSGNGLAFNDKTNFAVANNSHSDLTTHHEANHRLSNQLSGKFGHDQVNDLYDKLLSNIHPDVLSRVKSELGEYGYKTPGKKDHPIHHLAYKEEIVNAVRDMTQKGTRRDYIKTQPKKSIATNKVMTDDNGKPINVTFNPNATDRQSMVNNNTFRNFDKNLKNSWKNIVNTAKEHKFQKNELMKGSLQRRRRFDPKNIPTSQQNAIGDWQTKAKTEDKNKISRMEGNIRSRSLDRLGGKTQVKTKDGKRFFLLHRGMSEEEKGKHIGTDSTKYESGHINSWTPSHVTADRFSDDGAVSAWISEDDIHHTPSMSGRPATTRHTEQGKKLRPGKNPFDYEQEILVSHNNPHQLHSFENKPSNLDQKINTKFNTDLNDKSRYPARNLNIKQDKVGRIMSTPKKIMDTRKLAASEKMENDLNKGNALGKLAVIGTMAYGASQMAPKQDLNVSRRSPIENVRSVASESINKPQSVIKPTPEASESAEKPVDKEKQLFIRTLGDVFHKKYGNTASLNGQEVSDKYDKLSRYFDGNLHQMAHAFKYGPHETLNALENKKEMHSDPYVSNFVSTYHWNKNYNKKGKNNH